MTATIEMITIHAGEVAITATLTMPRDATGLALLAPGEGHSRFSPLDLEVARELEADGWATLLIDPLSEAEQAAVAEGAGIDRDVALIATRLTYAAAWAAGRVGRLGIPLAAFGEDVGGAAWLAVAARDPRLRAVACSGRPGLASRELANVQAPVLMLIDPRHDDTGAYLLATRATVEVIGGEGETRRAAVARRAAQWIQASVAAPLDGVDRLGLAIVRPLAPA